MSAAHNGSKIRLLLQGSDKDGWVAAAVLSGPKGPEITLERTAVFAAKELAGQAAYTAACEYIDNIRKRPRKRA